MNQEWKRGEIVRAREYRRQVWLNEEEKNALTVKSAQAGLSESNFIRYFLLDIKLKERPDEKFYEFTKQLTGIAHNINQLTVKAHKLGFIDDRALKRELEKLDLFIDELKDKYLRYNENKNGNNGNMEN